MLYNEETDRLETIGDADQSTDTEDGPVSLSGDKVALNRSELVTCIYQLQFLLQCSKCEKQFDNTDVYVFRWNEDSVVLRFAMDQRQPAYYDQRPRGMRKEHSNIRYTLCDQKQRAVDFGQGVVPLWVAGPGDEIEEELRAIEFLFSWQDVQA